MPTLSIATESKRPSKNQRLTDLYAAFHTGGAYDTKGQLVTDGKFNELLPSIAARTHTTDPGFKTKMQERATDFKMGLDGRVVTTTLQTSIYGPLDTTKYQP
jgi:hypothetical protein